MAAVGAAAAAACGVRGGPRGGGAGPAVTHGVQVGDVGGGGALVWARASEPARMVVEWDTSERFAQPRRVAGPVVGPDADDTAQVPLTGLPDGQTIAYRVRFEREAARGASAWVSGRFRTPHPDRARVVWTGDTCGQGFGRNPDWGGLRGYAALRAAEPDVFINSGDMIYADNPILPEVRLPDGRVWRNVSNERVARVAEELADFRARFAYNRDDDHVRALAAEVSTIAAWDDHEVRNNWWPGQQLDDPRYRVRDASLLAARALRATHEWNPLPAGPVHRVVHRGPLLDVFVLDLRSFRSPNDTGTGTQMMGAAQARWLVDGLARSRARWKLVACDQPLSLVIADDERTEGFATGTPPVVGREVELASVLAALQRQRVRNVVWVTADVHYAAAHHYDPARATAPQFDAFWEFIAGPIHAGCFGPERLDPTFGPEARFVWAPPAGQANLAPWDGLQSYGQLEVTRDAIAVELRGLDGAARWRGEIPWQA